MTDKTNGAPSKKPSRTAKEKASSAICKLRVMPPNTVTSSDLVRNEDERALLGAFRKVNDEEDRRYLIGVTRRCAEAQKPLRPVLQVVPADGAR